MKTTLTILAAIFVFCCFRAFAQEPTETAPVYSTEKIRIQVEESREKMSTGVNPGLKVYIPEAKKEDVEKDLVKYMKNYNVKGDAKKSEYFYDNAQIKAFGNNLVDIYSIVEQKAGGVELKIFFDLGGAYMSAANHPSQYKEAEQLVAKFAREEAAAAVGLQIAATQKLVETKMKEYDALVKQDSALSKKVHDCKAIILQAETDQQLNRTSQESKKKEIEDQQIVSEALKAKQAGIE
jgi:hypothetical protein